MAKKKATAVVTSDNQALADPAALETQRQCIVTEAVRLAPDVLKAMHREALSGNVKAARLILAVAGLETRPGTPMIGNANVMMQQINLTQGEVEALICELKPSTSNRDNSSFTKLS